MWTGEEIKFEKYKCIPNSIFVNFKQEIYLEKKNENNENVNEDDYDSSLDGWEDEKTNNIEKKYNLNKLLSL